jgi:hypothetical protein
VTQVDRLALTTGKNPVPEKKRDWGYRHEADKFGVTQRRGASLAPGGISIHEICKSGKAVNQPAQS